MSLNVCLNFSNYVMQDICILIFGIGEREYEISMIVQLRHMINELLCYQIDFYSNCNYSSILVKVVIGIGI